MGFLDLRKKIDELKNQTTGMTINQPSKDCPDDCKTAQKMVLSLANNNKDEDPTKIGILCWTCKKSIWHIEKRHEPIEEEEDANPL